jgi:hypothetical protein
MQEHLRGGRDKRKSVCGRDKRKSVCAGYSTLMPAVLTIGHHFSISDFW